MITTSTPLKNNANPLAMPTSSLDAPTADEEPGSRRPLLRLLVQLNRNQYYMLVLLIALYCLPTASATPTSTVASLWNDSTSLIKRATSDSASAATCACSATSEGTKHDAAFIVKACLIPLLVVLSGASAGLTIGFMTLDTTQLQVLIKSGSPRQQVWASKVLPLRKNGHLLLITLLISNMIFNEALPVIAESVFGGGIQAVVASTAMIVVFAEVIPQSVCSRFGLQIGAAMVWPVRIMIAILFIIAWPIAKLLEFILGPHDGIVYRRTELKELVALHAESAGRHGDLDVDTVAIVGATLDLQVKTVREAMTPISSLFSLPITAKLDFETLGKILEAGHSRIPVYDEIPVESSGEKKTRRKIIGVLLTKQLILLDPEDATPLRDIPISPLPLVADDLALLQILNTFQEGRSHMAVVCRRKFSPSSVPPHLETIPSASDTDLERGSSSPKDESNEGFFHTLFRCKRSGSGSSSSSSNEKGTDAGSTAVEKPSFSTLNLAELDEEFPQGIITLEDVLEELIGEEILDETDQDASHKPSMQHFIPPEAYGRVGNLAGPPPAPSAHIAQQAKQKSSSSKGGIVGAVGRISMGRSRSAPGQRRNGDKSASSSGSTTPKEETSGETTSSSLGGVLGAFGGGGGNRKRSLSPAPTSPNPRVVDFASTSAESGSTTTTSQSASLTGQPQVEEPQPLDSINETEAPTASSSSQPLSVNTRRLSTPGVSNAPLPSPSLLSDAVLLERGRRAMIAKGSDPAQLNLANLRLAGTSRSQSGPRNNAPIATTATSLGAASQATNEAEMSSSGTRAPRGAFKSPAQMSALPQAAKVNQSKEKEKEVGGQKEVDTGDAKGSS
ncbi:uncharacterized protein JCM6883_004029 [Sporobolomyces salmoneus]|uniref:uncharacterized protein n=1 Tax=Sporobolomyces salmoneus TaxID=183962 RepID=UPI00316D934F